MVKEEGGKSERGKKKGEKERQQERDEEKEEKEIVRGKERE